MSASRRIGFRWSEVEGGVSYQKQSNPCRHGQLRLNRDDDDDEMIEVYAIVGRECYDTGYCITIRGQSSVRNDVT